jgi:hypothetical protein
MIGVLQTEHGADYGNCFAACVASLLHLRIDEVPTLRAENGDPPWSCEVWNRVYLPRVREFLADRRIMLMNYAFQSSRPLSEVSIMAPVTRDRGFWIAGVASIRHKDQFHAVVCRGLEIVWDPSGKLLSTDLYGNCASAFFLVPFDPMQTIKQVVQVPIPRYTLAPHDERPSAAEEIVGEIQRLGLGDDVAASLAGDWPLGDGRDDEQGEECRQNAVRAARIGLWTQ